MPSESSSSQSGIDLGNNLFGIELMGFLKTFSFPSKASFSLPVLNAPQVHLRMISTVEPSEDDIQRLSEWRNRHIRSFLTEFNATPKRTREWLTHIIARDLSRILFMIEEPGQSPFGYIGLAFIDYDRHYAEADSVVRGDTRYPGVMRLALHTLIEWARTRLEIRTFGVRVLGDNPAVTFYEKFGFREVRRTPLQPETSPGLVVWKETLGVLDPKAEIRWLLHMELPTF